MIEVNASKIFPFFETLYESLSCKNNHILVKSLQHLQNMSFIELCKEVIKEENNFFFGECFDK